MSAQVLGGELDVRRRRCSPPAAPSRRVPGMGTIQGFGRAARPARSARAWRPCGRRWRASRSTSAWLAFRASAVKRGMVARMSVLANVVSLVDRAGEEALAERAEGDEADAEFFQRRQHLVLGPPPPQRVLALQGGHRLDGVGAADGRRRRPRTGRSAGPCPRRSAPAPAPATSSIGTSGFDPVLVDTGRSPRRRAGAATRRPACVMCSGRLSRPAWRPSVVEREPELGGDDHLVANRGQGLARRVPR